MAKRSGARDPGRPPAVALLIETSNQYSRQILRGVRDYLREGGPWALHLTEHGRGDVPPPWLSRWRGDGIIARIENRTIERAVRTARIPAVNVSASGLATEFPAVITDSAAVARMAAEHLLERGFRRFGYCGDARFAWSATHGRHFAAFVRKAGCDCSLFPSSAKDFADWEGERRKLARWIASLPRPAGIMACYDIRGLQVLDVCRQIGLRVPDEVAVIGQHNDEPLCELCAPPLSSVIPNPRQAGYRAAGLLDRMMRGRRARPRVHRIAPLGIAARQSTDAVAVEDREVAAAVRFIRENAHRGIGVADILKAVPISRSLLERRFRGLMGCAPYEAILRARLRRAKELLAATDLPVARVAERSGFSCPAYLSAAFRQQTGLSPRQFRQRNTATSE